MTRLVGLLRLTHPFPSLLDGVACAAFALVAGGAPPTAVRLGVAMVALQAAIGAVNDLVDAPRDAGLKAGKPIPAGLVPPWLAGLVALAGLALGLLLAAPSGAPTVGLAVVGVAVGLAYDLRFKGTAWSWLPLSIGIPLLPVFGWLGATGTLAPAFAVLVPMAVAAGAALAIGNSLVDVERDRAAGVGSVAVALGARRARMVQVGLLLAVGVVAVASVPLLGGGAGETAAVAAVAFVPLAAATVGRSADPARRERAWQAGAIGVALLAVAWIVAVLG